MRGTHTPGSPWCRRSTRHRVWRRQAPQRPSRRDRRFGWWLRIWREARGLSREELAAGVGVTTEQVARHELGLERIAAHHLARYAEFLGVSLAAFLG